jgi:hypothetical protein
LTNTGCIKQENVRQTQLNISHSDEVNDQVSETSDTRFSNVPAEPPSGSMIISSGDTRGITDITEYFTEQLKDKPEDWFSRVSSLQITQLYSSEGNLEHLGNLKMFSNLEYLIVKANLITVDTDGLPDSLVSLDLSDNNIVSFSGTLPQELSILKLSRNNITNFNVEDLCDCLFILDLSYNKLSSFDVSSLPQFLSSPVPVQIDLSYNNISSFDMASLPENVGYIDLFNNPLEGHLGEANRDHKLRIELILNGEIDSRVRLGIDDTQVVNPRNLLELKEIFDLVLSSYLEYFPESSYIALRNFDFFVEQHQNIYFFQGKSMYEINTYFSRYMAE